MLLQSYDEDSIIKFHQGALRPGFRRCSTHVPRAVSESIWCGKRVKFNRVCQTFVELNLGLTHGAILDQMLHQCCSKVKLVQLGLAHEKYGV